MRAAVTTATMASPGEENAAVTQNENGANGLSRVCESVLDGRLEVAACLFHFIIWPYGIDVQTMPLSLSFDKGINYPVLVTMAYIDL